MKDCSFWHDVMHDIDLNSCDQSFFSKFYKQRNIDSCGDDFYSGSYLRRFFKLFGYEPGLFFPEKSNKVYADKYAFLFDVFFRVSGKGNIVDSSKDTFWLKLLLRVPQIDVKVIWLQRDLKALYSSKIKRLKKRSFFYTPIHALFAAIWVVLYYGACKRLYKEVDSDSKIVINYDEFISNAEAVQEKCSELLSEEIDLGINADGVMNFKEQHFISGNRWIFNLNNNSIKLVDNADDSHLGGFEKAAYVLVLFLYRLFAG